jgi:hypothetical protein
MFARRLPVAAVGKAAELSIHLIPPDPHKGAGGDCNYAEGDRMVLMLRLTNGRRGRRQELSRGDWRHPCAR